MKVISFLLFLLFAPCVLGKVIPNQASAECDQYSSVTDPTGCLIDLTVAIDMSSYLGTNANISILSDSILRDFLTTFNFKETYVAGITFGSTIDASNYFDNLGAMCEFIHAGEQNAIELGLGSTTLLKVLQTYDMDLLRNGRNYKKVLVLLSASKSSADINAAKVYANNLRSYGVFIVVGDLTHNSNGQLSQLGDYTFYAPDLQIPSLNLTSEVCQFGGVTVYPANSTAVPPTPTGPTNPLSNLIGAPCSTNTQAAWLDIVFVIDVSGAMKESDLEQLVSQILSYMTVFTFGTTPGNHTIRAGIVTYATDANTILSLSDSTDFDAFIQALLGIEENDPNDNGVSIDKGLRTAFNMLKSQKSANVPAIILTSAAYREDGFSGAVGTANEIKDDGIAIMVVNFGGIDGVLNENLKVIASEGYYYHSTDSDIGVTVPTGLTQINCFCPAGSLQLKVYNMTSQRTVSYADCIWGSPSGSRPSIIPLARSCDPGVLVAVTSQKKLDFITDNVLPYMDIYQGQGMQKKEFICGAHIVGDQWYWYGYNKTEYPLGSFPLLNINSPDHKYAFYQQGSGFLFNLMSSGDDLRPYLCQSRACDADFLCDQKKP